ncbi:Inner membrane protein YedI [Alphaproteobacteria bacterium SO-S41]|nr:Inner membrane protein YedI [Alphaproteobacteria bacterium SO-S41]
MASGLIALLDDIVAITKLAAASLNDVVAAAGKASVKAAGVVIDDTAVTPQYVTGFKPERELPIIARIAWGSLRNKLFFILPVALALSAFAPWAITPLLMLGAAYLCFEAAEKVLHYFHKHEASPTEDLPVMLTPELEKEKIGGAIRTDFILSAEIMAITLAEVSDRSLTLQVFVLAAVGILVTVAVYGAVAAIVKMDDVGLILAKAKRGALRWIGRALVTGMPVLMTMLSVVGTAAMAWVGGGILVHSLELYGLTAIPHAVHDLAEGAGRAISAAAGIVSWLVSAFLYGVIGLIVGTVVVAARMGLSAVASGRPAN